MICVWVVFIYAALMSLTGAQEKEKKCLTTYPEVNPKKYIHYEGKSLDIVIDTSERITHQLSTWVFYYFIKEIIGYSKVKIVEQRDHFDIERSIQKVTDIAEDERVPKSTINLEVWIPPDYDTYATDFVIECGSVSPPGRFGWFIPNELTGPIRDYYNPNKLNDIRSIHWRFFRDEKVVKFFDIDVNQMPLKKYLTAISEENSCPQNICDGTMFTPTYCKSGKQRCGLLLSSNYNSTKFVIKHIKENKLLMRVLFVGDDLASLVIKLKEKYWDRNDVSLVVLSWVPSDVVLYERDFVTVSFENSERLNFTHAIGYKYEMHRLVKVAWSKIENIAKPLYDAVRSFKFETDEYERLLSLYEAKRYVNTPKEIACDFLYNNNKTWIKWQKSPESYIYIGGIFPMSGSSYGGQGILQAALLAATAINNNKTLLPNYHLKLLATDGMCRAENVMKNFIEFIVDPNYYNSLVGVLGPACSDTVEPLAGVSKYYHIMAISYSAEGSSFSDREKYPYFFRTIGENKYYKHVYMELFKQFKWNRVAALTEDGQKYTEYISLMQDDLELNGISFVANKKFPRERETEPMTRYLEDLREKRARIIIADVVDEIARQVMCEAYKLNMTGAEGYVWFLPMWLNKTWYNTDYFNLEKNETVNCTTHEMIKAITGYFSMTHAYYAPYNQTMQENISVGDWLKKYKKVAKANMSNYGGFAYDAVWVYALALDKLARTDAEALSDLHSENTTNKLVKIVEQTDFYGVSGRIKFRGGPSRFSVINIMEWYENDTHLIGEFTPNLADNSPEILGGDLALHPSVIKWFTHDGKVPGDGTQSPPGCTIERIAKLFDVECQSAMILLNVMIGTLAIVIISAICFYIKFKYDRKVQKQREYLKKLGITNERQIPANLDDLEVPRENVEINRRLGVGAFGCVYGGEAELPWGRQRQVAVKTLKLHSPPEDRIDFLKEADTMKRFDHPNVIKLVGVITRTQPLHTLMEFCLYGDVKTYLLSRRNLTTNKNSKRADEVSPRRLTSMAMDIARGMSYLAELKFVHRDLACRNCLVNDSMVVKVGDFGMTRQMGNYECYRFTRKGMLPVRWMAPESLFSGIFTAASDMWSYGVVLYEIVTFGCMPWAGKTNLEVVEEVRGGKTLEAPEGLKQQLQSLMNSCWQQNPKDRPTASSVVEFLANNGKLLTPSKDVPVQSIVIDEVQPTQLTKRPGIKLSEIDFTNEFNFLNSPKAMMEPHDAIFEIKGNPPLPQSPDNAFDLSPEDDSTVSIQLETICPKAPLLGPSKSSSSLINYGKFQMQSNRTDSCHEEDDEGFIGNSPSNGYINSKL
ncbi:uncharacterized protein LOC143202875 isoform X1 [Rhynchophorus ferrugineus]|uniref:uncharacterized protein LOC143202875 isoform X1 n=1 Tax=Rhynchophorus ferrugineus TaxID=354439 RepID=UPI003FCC3AE5